MGSKIDLHPVVLILSLLIGAKLYGILGMLFAVPVAAVYRVLYLSLIHISEPTRLGMISYAVFCLKKKNRSHETKSNLVCRLLQDKIPTSALHKNIHRFL